jgi:nucleoside-triphosphatase THEP1
MSIENTPKDYTDRKYRVYFEVMDIEEKVKKILASYSSTPLSEKPYGYEATVAMQMIPEIIRKVAAENIAIYQVIREGERNHS